MTAATTIKPPRVVLITGASSGIGHAAALAFARRGDQVAATARRVDRLDELQRSAAGLPGKILAIAADVRDAAQVQSAVDQTIGAFGRLDVLVANAGLGQRGPLADANWIDIEDVLRTNIDGALHSVRAAVPALRRAGGGHIVLVSSVTAYITTPYATTYAATKAALNAFGRGLRTELAPDHIWVTNLLVGQTHTEFSKVRRGKPGQIAGVPGMAPEKVADAIVRVTTLRRRQYTIRLFDKVLMAAGQYLAPLMDRIVARSYKT